MKLADEDLEHLASCAADAAEKAGEMIARSRPAKVERKQGGDGLASQVVTEIDRKSQELILDALAPTRERFELGLLTEESEDDGSRHRADYFWCIDPLDGTLPFVEETPGYAVSIALVGRDGRPEIGAVYDPVEGIGYRARRGGGLVRNKKRWQPGERKAADQLGVFVDRSFVADTRFERVCEELERAALAMGLKGLRVHPPAAAVMNACWVLATPPACYFKFPKAEEGGGCLWDFAAGACFFSEAGSVATDIYGQSLDLNRVDSSYMNHRGVMFATDEQLAAKIRQIWKGIAEAR